MVKRQVIPNWRRALELLADSADGCTEALLFAHGFTEATIAGGKTAHKSIAATPAYAGVLRPVVDYAEMWPRSITGLGAATYCHDRARGLYGSVPC
jgi:hypothetical protein